MDNSNDSTLFVWFTIAEALERVRDSFVSTGMPQDLALIAADAIVQTEAHGVVTHGLTLLPKYLRHLESGFVDAAARPEVVHRQGGVARVDGKNGLGHLAAMLASDTAQEIARSEGIGIVAAGGSNHAGCLGHYARSISRTGNVGLVFGTSTPSMFAAGGRSRTLGNNPMAVGIPTGQAPIVLDMAMSRVARRHISLAAERSEGIPLGWALDRQGKPTEDATEALAGALESFGGTKASGLAVVVGMLASGFGGAGMGSDLGDLDQGLKPGTDGLSVIAINPEFFGLDKDAISSFGLAADVLRLDDSGKVDPNVRLPGDGSNARYERALTEGLLVEKGVWEEILSRSTQKH
jgi:LDH2 family malate/lactate/ureidoglycolate dehydrogenase